MRSGMGDPAVLAAAGVPCRVARPELGQNLHDHMLAAGVVYRARQNIAPSLAPMIGGFLGEWSSWRATFWFVGGFGAILFLTGFDKFDYARQAISVRAMDYLLKPYNERELVFAVEDAIRQVSVQLPARPAQPPAPAEPLRREEDEDMRTAIIRAEISRFIDAHYGEDISMQDAAAALRYSDAYFCKLFKQCFKVNFSAYLNEYRVNKARQLILDPRLSLKDIGAAVGYSDANYFTRVFKRLTGQTPSEYRVAAAEKAAQG